MAIGSASAPKSILTRETNDAQGKARVMVLLRAADTIAILHNMYSHLSEIGKNYIAPVHGQTSILTDLALSVFRNRVQ